MSNSKRDRSLRFLVNYKKLETVFVCDSYPILKWMSASTYAQYYPRSTQIEAFGISKSTTQFEKNSFHFVSWAVKIFKNDVWIAHGT